MHADVGAVEPVAGRVVRGQPSALDDLAEGVADVLEVERQADRRGRADDPVAVERHELAVGEELDVPPVVSGLEPLVVGEGRKADSLQLFELLGVFRPRVHHHETAVEAAVVPHTGGPAATISRARGSVRRPPSTSTTRSMSSWVLNTDTDRRSRFSLPTTVAATLPARSALLVAAASFSAKATIGVGLPRGVSERIAERRQLGLQPLGELCGMGADLVETQRCT